MPRVIIKVGQGDNQRINGEGSDVTCPRCREGPIERVRFGRVSLMVKKCAECDAVWAKDAEPSTATFVQFQILLDILGEVEVDTPYEVLGVY